MALAVVSIFADADADIKPYAVLSGVSLLVSLPCLSIWAALGARADSSLQSGTCAKVFNVILGAALLASAWVWVWEHN